MSSGGTFSGSTYSRKKEAIWDGIYDVLKSTTSSTLLSLVVEVGMHSPIFRSVDKHYFQQVSA